MAGKNTSIYLPDGLARKAREHRINISQTAADAIAAAVERYERHCARCGQPLPDKEDNGGQDRLPGPTG